MKTPTTCYRKVTERITGISFGMALLLDVVLKK